MKFLAMCIEACAIWGANCASVCLSYQPKLPECLKLGKVNTCI